MDAVGVRTLYLRCGQCLDKFGGTAPIMGHLVDDGQGHWLPSRWIRRPGMIDGHRSTRPRHNDAGTDEIFVPGRGAKALQLRCRRCRHAPRVAIRKLHELAAAATFVDRKADAYL